MESYDHYLARKAEEIAFLASRLDDDFALGSQSTPDDIFRIKMALRAEAFAQACRNHPNISETRIFPHLVVDFEGYRLEFAYQRFDLSIDGPPLYPSLMSDDHIAKTLYTNCGMSAITSIFLSLSRIFEHADVLTLDDTYFETQHMVTEFTPSLRLHVLQDPDALAERTLQISSKTTGPVVLILDSFSRDDASIAVNGLPPGAVDLVVFDTTCYSVNDPHLVETARAALDAGTPVVLVRSHIKLDSLGVEFGRLGSILISTDWPSLAEVRRPMIEALVQTTLETMRILGCTASPLSLIPYRDSVFHDLNDRRIERIRENTRLFTARFHECAPEGIRLEAYHHEIFAALQVQWIGSRGALTDAIKTICSNLADEGLPVRHAGSFGFDFISIDEFVDLKTQDPVMRVSPSDLPTSMIETFCASFFDLLRKP